MNIQYFQNQNLFDAGKQLFDTLQIPLNTNTSEPIDYKQILGERYKPETYDIFEAINEVYFFGKVDNEVFSDTGNKIYLQEAVENDREGIIILGIDLNWQTERLPSRSKLAHLTRVFNRAIKQGVPVIMLFRYKNYISLATTERTEYKQEWRQGEKIGKVTILKDIKTDKPHRAHLDILQKLSVWKGEQKDLFSIATYEQLYQHWRKTFDVEELNKNFYKKIANWFFWALEHSKYPRDAKKDANGQFYEAGIRLITRFIFIWFLKEKRFVKEELFNKKYLSKLLKNLSNNESSYYQAILQNLFFATLNTPYDDRDFRTEIRGHKGRNEDMGNHYAFRFQALVKDIEKWKTLFNEVPFLNGGIFDCLDYKPLGIKDKDRKYIDGFSERGKQYQAQIPNFLFFAPPVEHEKPYDMDFSKIFGKQKNKKYYLAGLIELLNSYKFTVEENTPLEETVALNPELLGNVFQNLLASFNEETQEVARKKTGSFYTPIPVVNYMAQQSLKNHLVKELKKNADPKIIEKIDSLFSYTQSKNPFDPETSKQLIKIIENLKILDPACGSGAYPMGILQTMVHILRKLDPENKVIAQRLHKKAKQENKEHFDKIEKDYNKAIADIQNSNKTKIQKIEKQYNTKIKEIDDDKKQLDSLKIKRAKNRALQELEKEKQTIDKELQNDKQKAIQKLENEKAEAQKLHDQAVAELEKSLDLSKNELDYARNLFLIRNCIYSIDIQPIAVQITKLRFFLALVIEQKSDNKEDILPLPNLETKIVAANSLIALHKPLIKSLFDTQKEILEEDLKFVRQQHFEARGKEQKEKIKEEDKQIRTELKNIFIEELDSAVNEKKRQIEQLDKNKELNLQAIDRYTQQLRNSDTPKIRKRKIETDLKRLRKAIYEIEKQKLPLQAFINNKDIYEATYNQLANFDIYNPHNEAAFFDPYWMFFMKDGFDIVIGNPPYYQIQKMNAQQKTMFVKQNYETYQPTGDIYALFYEKGINLLKPQGVLCYITSNKWMRANYGSSLRGFFSRKNPVQLIDMGPGVFTSATVDTNILLVEKTENQQQLKALTLTKQHNIENLKTNDFVSLRNLTAESWIILSEKEQSIKQKIEQKGTPLADWDININYGIKTGYNNAFIIDGKTKDRLIEQDPNSEEVLKPILRGRDIKRYKAEFADLWLINTHNGVKADSETTKHIKQPYIEITDDYGIEVLEPDAFDIEPVSITDYPAVKKYLDQFFPKLKKRQDKGYTPYNLRNCAYLEEFEKEKIVYPETTLHANFYFDTNKTIIEKTSFMLIGKELKYLTALLNSNCLFFAYKKYFSSVILGNSGYQYNKHAILKFPIPQISKEFQKPFEALVEQIIAKKAQDEPTQDLENQIDLLVYRLYGLNYEEVKIIDPEIQNYEL